MFLISYIFYQRSLLLFLNRVLYYYIYIYIYIYLQHKSMNQLTNQTTNSLNLFETIVRNKTKNDHNHQRPFKNGILMTIIGII